MKSGTKRVLFNFITFMKLSLEQLNKLHRYNISVRGPDLKSM